MPLRYCTLPPPLPGAVCLGMCRVLCSLKREALTLSEHSPLASLKPVGWRCREAHALLQPGRSGPFPCGLPWLCSFLASCVAASFQPEWAVLPSAGARSSI